ncbi:LppX_LprAFG lipoprotein [Tsukamurella sp. NPDC003166]|uniref:LppX_LprAFG lipoprotein n=1 Tax=Tsukamurella sp. NPDC003166 TaxID=3154444 RepID=UPI0033ABFA23
MKFTASRTAIALLAAGALVLTGCADKKTDDTSSGGGTTTAAAQSGASGAPSAAPSVDANGLPTVQIVKDAALATRETYSEHLTLAVDKGIQGLPVTSVTGDIISFKDTKRVAAQGDANVRVKDSYVQTKFVVIDGMLYANLGGAKYQPMGKTGEKGVYDPAIILDLEKGLAKILDSMQDPKVEGKDTVNGLKTVKVTGTVATQVLDPLLPQITDIATRGNAGTSLPITLWIVFDASANPMPKPNVTRMEVKLKELPITLNLTEFGKDVKIEKPAT